MNRCNLNRLIKAIQNLNFISLGSKSKNVLDPYSLGLIDMDKLQIVNKFVQQDGISNSNLQREEKKLQINSENNNINLLVDTYVHFTYFAIPEFFFQNYNSAQQYFKKCLDD